MQRIFLDFETASEVDIRKVGLSAYVAHPSTRVLFLWWATDEGDPELWDPTLHPPLDTPAATFTAFNADFERNIWTRVLGFAEPPAWEDAAHRARIAGLTGKLSSDTKFLGFPGEEKADGNALVRRFSMPQKDGSFSTRETHPEEWRAFVEYGRQDVIALRSLYNRIARPFPVPPVERRVIALDWTINDRGIPVDVAFAARVQERAKVAKTNLLAEAKAFTGLENPNSVPQMLRFVQAEGYPFKSLSGAKVRQALVDPAVPERAKRGLDYRLKLGRSSISKLDALDLREVDGRIRFAYKYYGAHTGRWSGSGFQPQNLPRPIEAVANDYSNAVAALRSGADITPWGSELDVIASTLRAVIHAQPGKHLVASDASQIEVRVLGWLADDEVIDEIFRLKQDPYKVFAGGWLHKVPAEVSKLERQTAKPAVLAAGFGTGVGDEEEDKHGDIILTGLRGYAQNMGIHLPKDTARELINTYRKIHWRVVKLWKDLEYAAREAVEVGTTTQVGHLVVGGVPGKVLWMDLPSGRRLVYPRPKYRWVKRKPNEEPKLALTYKGVIGTNFTTKVLYGGLLTENAVQAVARDVLAEGMLEADRQGFYLVGHTHDEIFAEQTPGDGYTHERLNDILRANPSWAPDIPLDADGWTAVYYQK